MPGRVRAVPVVVLIGAAGVPGTCWAGLRRGRRPAHGHWAGLLVAPRVFRAPEAPAAREARRPHFVRHRASKPARALRTLRRPPHRRRFGTVNSLALPRHRPRGPQPGPLAPCGPAGVLHSRLLSLTAVAGDSRETIIAFTGVCSVSGETDDTIASRRHLFLLLFHRAKASWVSYRRPDAPALVLTVTSRGAVSSRGASFRECGRVGVCWANFGARRHLNQVPKPSIGTEAGPFHACLPSRPMKPAAYADR